MRRLVLRCAILALSSALAGCNTLPEPTKLSADEARAVALSEIDTKGPPAIQVIRVSPDALSLRPVHDPLPSEMANRVIDIRFPEGPVKLDDLVRVLATKNIQIVFAWDDQKAGETVLEHTLPFDRYQGTFEGMLKALRSGMGIAYWTEGGSVMLSENERFAITLPQDKDVIKSVSDELENLGLDKKKITQSLRSGKVFYSATPRMEDEVIAPYAERLVRSLAMVNLQVAIVTLAVTDNTSTGFDWSQFGAALDSRNSTKQAIAQAQNPSSSTTGTGSSGTGTSTGTGTGSTGTGSGSTGTGSSGSSSSIAGNSTVTTSITTPSDIGSLVDLTGEGLVLSRAHNLGTLGVLSVAGAIDFLSTFGKTTIKQNVGLQTLSGSDVKLRSGEVIPYVSGVGVSSTNNGGSSSSSGNLLGSASTSTVETGLTLKMTPHYDADTQTVTVSVDLDVKSVLQFIQLSAGTQIGSLSQPETQDQSLTSLVRMRVGQTVVIGGLQYDSVAYNGNDPAMARNGGDFLSNIGLNSQTVSRNALFIVMRPAVTIVAPQQVSDNQIHAAPGSQPTPTQAHAEEHVK